MLRDNGFHAYFSGHQHAYERFDFNGFLSITTGGGGGNLEQQAWCDDDVIIDEARFSLAVHHHVSVELGCEQARLWAKDMEGNIIEEVDIFLDGSHQLRQ